MYLAASVCPSVCPFVLSWLKWLTFIFFIEVDLDLENCHF